MDLRISFNVAMLLMLTAVVLVKTNETRRCKRQDQIQSPSPWFYIKSAKSPNLVLSTKGELGCLLDRVVWKRKASGTTAQMWRWQNNMLINRAFGYALDIDEGNAENGLVLYYPYDNQNQQWQTISNNRLQSNLYNSVSNLKLKTGRSDNQVAAVEPLGDPLKDFNVIAINNETEVYK